MPKPLIRRAREVLKRQEPWLQHWDDLARVMLPRMRGFSENIQAGDSRVDEIYDGTPMRDARGLAHAIGMMVPSGFLSVLRMKASSKAVMTPGRGLRIVRTAYSMLCTSPGLNSDKPWLR